MFLTFILINSDSDDESEEEEWWIETSTQLFLTDFF